MPEPTKIPRPFADSGDKNSIPDSSGGLGFASWQEGFPAITGTPFAQGGVAPKRADFNGIFNALSLATLWQQQGGFYAYDNTTDYEVGNVVEYSGDLYKCLTANGPSSAVKAPTDTTVWSKVMTAADTEALYLPLSGGTMTGTIKINVDFPILSNSGTTGRITLAGGQTYANGALMGLYGKDHSSNPGQISLDAFDGVNLSRLLLKPDGTLTWNSKDVATIQTGTWTPVLKGGSVAGTFTYSAQDGRYIKIGDLVYIVGQVQITDYGTYPTGAVVIDGLPFVGNNSVYSFGMCVQGYSGGVDNSVLKIASGYVNKNGTTITCLSHSKSAPQNMSNASWSSSSTSGYEVMLDASHKNATIYISGVYLTI